MDEAFFIPEGNEFQQRGTTYLIERGSDRPTNKLFLADRVLWEWVIFGKNSTICSGNKLLKSLNENILTL